MQHKCLVEAQANLHFLKKASFCYGHRKRGLTLRTWLEYLEEVVQELSI